MTNERILITGGAGFIGSNLADLLLAQGHRITILDNLCRGGSDHNLAWLRDRYGEAAFEVVRANVADYTAFLKAAEGAQRIYHLAGQVAVTKSVEDPRGDFEANALGTLNMLEAARSVADNPIVIYASTNKVYGCMTDLSIEEQDTRYTYSSMPLGIPETRGLDFHSPYGCSKGAGDQYVRDYHRIYGMRTVVARQSCIYGSRQLGIEDQGWLAWFTIAALKQRSISIFGNGKQVRDALFITDLVDAYEAFVRNINVASGQVYNIGGGVHNTISIWREFGPKLERLVGKSIPVAYNPWRPGDQLVYISDIRKARNELGWSPKVSVDEGVEHLYRWIRDNQPLFAHL